MNVIYLFFMLWAPVAFNLQDPALPINEKGKVAFEEEVVVEHLGKDALRLNALSFFERVKKAGERNPRRPTLEAEGVSKEGSFYVYTKGLFTPQIHGEIKYTIKIELKENAYKYSYTDFVFQFYERKRHGRYGPVSGKVKPLEEEEYAGMQNTWESHKALTKEAIEKHIFELKKKMREVPPGALNNEDSHFQESY